MSGKSLFTATVYRNSQIRPGYWRVDLDLDSSGSEAFNEVVPGQFAELRVSDISLPPAQDVPPSLRDLAQRNIILRRPFSFCDVHQGAKGIRIGILYCVLGPATVRMMSLERGDQVSLIGPLGNGYAIRKEKLYAILIAGGMGAPPVMHLGEYLKTKYPEVIPIAFLGARSMEHLPYDVHIDNEKGAYAAEYDRMDIESHIATDDGSIGFRGVITQYVEKWLIEKAISPEQVVLYACGPEMMLAATATLAFKYSIECQVSMERMMACGIGLCQSCVVTTKTEDGIGPYKLCCKDGPVFDSKDVVFE
ncbi:MAG: dihydroorotate dehydrogenase electron transfer subunit [Sedimentisphaerales bacterium]|nr:dihydroorotate dehydrogenase electron transfer subunit [Sedimentisphaerales bacterium]